MPDLHMLVTAARCRRLRALLGALGLGVLAVGIVVGTQATGSGGGESHSANAITTVLVARRDFVGTETVTGRLGYADPETVYNRVRGTVTYLPTVGQTVNPGQALYRVNNTPVVMFNGATPAYRALSAAVKDGPDVEELNQNLVGLGFDSQHQITVNNTWQSATTAAVKRWQGAFGEAETGTIAFGQIVFLPGARMITAVKSRLGSLGRHSTRLAPVAGQTQFVSLTTTPTTCKTDCKDTHESTTTSTTATSTTPSAVKVPKPIKVPSFNPGKLNKALADLKKAEEALRQQRSVPPQTTTVTTQAPTPAPVIIRVPAPRPKPAGPAAILETSSTQQVVTVALQATKEADAVVGAPVTVTLPDANTVDGQITQVSPVAFPHHAFASSGSATSVASETIPVTVTLSGAPPPTGFETADVDVNFEPLVENDMLSVPVSALLETPSGFYAVQEATAPYRLLPVTPGLFTGGYIEVSGADLHPGLKVKVYPTLQTIGDFPGTSGAPAADGPLADRAGTLS